jgi:hypothetical protein
MLLLPLSVGPATTTRGPWAPEAFASSRKLWMTWWQLMYDMLGVSSAI